LTVLEMAPERNGWTAAIILTCPMGSMARRPTAQSTQHLGGLAPCTDYVCSCLGCPMERHRQVVHIGTASTVHVTLHLPQHPETQRFNENKSKVSLRYHKTSWPLHGSTQCNAYSSD
jgi:hypothetical protein